MLLEINQDCAIGLPLAACPVVHAQNPWRFWLKFRRLPHQTEQGVGAGYAPQAWQQPRTMLGTERKTDPSLFFDELICAACIRRYEVRKQRRKGPAWTLFVVAKEARHGQAQLGRISKTR